MKWWGRCCLRWRMHSDCSPSGFRHSLHCLRIVRTKSSGSTVAGVWAICNAKLLLLVLFDSGIRELVKAGFILLTYLVNRCSMTCSVSQWPEPVGVFPGDPLEVVTTSCSDKPIPCLLSAQFEQWNFDFWLITTGKVTRYNFEKRLNSLKTILSLESILY